MITVHVSNVMQRDYSYELVAPEGEGYDPRFRPELTPAEMLKLGVFGGWYLNSALKSGEYPENWSTNAKLSHYGTSKDCNLYKVTAGQSLAVWRDKGWIDPRDPRGFFEWYCRYYRGRRCNEPWDNYDERQILRWVNFGTRHIPMLRSVQRRGGEGLGHKQAIIQWAYDARKL